MMEETRVWMRWVGHMTANHRHGGKRCCRIQAKGFPGYSSGSVSNLCGVLEKGKEEEEEEEEGRGPGPGPGQTESL